MVESIVPIEHTLVDGVYTRIAYAIKGQLIIGCRHKQGGVAILLSGAIKQIDGEDKYEIKGPRVFNTEAGTQRNALVVEDCTYMTVHSTTAKTVEEAEKLLFEGTPQLTRIRNSFKELVLEHKTTDTVICKDPQKMFTEDTEKYYLGNSNIHGTGVFSAIDFTPGDIIAINVLDGVQLTTSRYVNHSDIPNAQLVDYKDSIVLIALKHMPKGYEILIDYNKGLQCQQ